LTDHPIQFYDTMTRMKKPFVPLNPPNVTMYVCGPTVYGDPHIGNIRTFTSGDLIRRWLEYRGYHVRYVMNITDIDDKTIRDSGKAGKTLKEFTEHFTKVFFRGLDQLNIMRATAHPRATMYIPQMIDFIQALIDKGYAYEAQDGVYFDISKYVDYGKLSGINLEMTERSERVSKDEYAKDNPQDFALWKKSIPEEMSRGIFFNSPWGPGRPGWHIECSVMSKELLGETIDIHAGGEDLVFPHHENEVAQSESLSGKQFVRYWLHMRHLMIEGGKMSKSLGNYVSFDEVLKRVTPDAFRYFYISTQYGRPLNFTWNTVDSAQNTVKRLENTLDLIDEALNGPEQNLDYHGREDKFLKTIWEEKKGFIEAMDDDINTPIALGHLHAINNAINEYVIGPVNKGVLEEASKQYKELLNILGLFPRRGWLTYDLSEKLIRLITDLREEQRKAKNYVIADEIRQKLEEVGVVIQDTPGGVTWKIVQK
jgi:cysteinyl-tRNA synthetase